MKRVVYLLCLLPVLMACAGPQPEELIGARLPAQVGLPSEETVFAAPAGLEDEAAAIPAAVPTFESSVLLAQWNPGEKQHEVRPVDPATGRPISGYNPIVVDGEPLFASRYTFSTAGERVAIIGGRGQYCQAYAGGSTCWPEADTLYLIDVHAWRLVTAALPGTGRVAAFTFTPDADFLALAYQEREANTLFLFNSSGEVLDTRTLDFPPTLMNYSRDGSSLLLYGTAEGAAAGIAQADPPQLLLLDGETLDTRWQQQLPEVVSGSWCTEECDGDHVAWRTVHWQPAVVPSRDGEKLYIIHADSEEMTTIDLKARALQSLPIEAAYSWWERLLALTAGVAHAKSMSTGAVKTAVLSPDGTKLYLVGQVWDISEDEAGGQAVQVVEPLGLQVIDVDTGRKTATYETTAERIRITSDGRYLLLDGWDKAGMWTEILEAGSLRSINRLSGWEIIPTRRVDGRALILAMHGTPETKEMVVLDGQSFLTSHTWQGQNHASWLAHTQP